MTMTYKKFETIISLCFRNVTMQKHTRFYAVTSQDKKMWN